MTGTNDTTAPPRHIEYMALSYLAEHTTPGNPKGHAIADMRVAFRELGYLDGLVWDERTDLLIGGHGRVEALALDKAEGLEPPEGVLVQADGEWLVPVQRGFRSRDDDHAKRSVVALNQIGVKGGWNPQLLADFMEGTSWEGTGFEPGELDDLFAGLGPLELDPVGTDAEHAALPPARKGEAPPPKVVQGLRELVVLLNIEQRQEFDALVAQLRSAWGEEVMSLIILRVVREAAAALTA